MRIAALRRVLTALLWFGAVSAAVGGFLGVVVNGAGLPLAYLRGSVFTSYRVPGLLLGVVVGGTQAFAAIAVGRARPGGLGIASVAGGGMLIWIFAELVILGEYSFLQSVYFALGLVELFLVLVLGGVLVRRRR